MWSRCLVATEEVRLQATQIQALLHCEIGFCWYTTGKIAEAVACYQRSAFLLERSQIVDGYAWAYVYYRQGYAAWRSGAYADALCFAHKALNCQGYAPARPAEGETAPITQIGRLLAGEKVFLGRIHQLLGLIANDAGGPHQETVEHWTAALAIFEQFESKRDIAVLLCNLGDVYLKQADFSSAGVCLPRALDRKSVV